jgi:hypothetical protein
VRFEKRLDDKEVCDAEEEESVVLRKKRPMRFFKYVDENASCTHSVADKAIGQRRQQQIRFFQAFQRLLFRRLGQAVELSLQFCPLCVSRIGQH